MNRRAYFFSIIIGLFVSSLCCMQKEDKKALLSRLHSHIQWKKQRRSEGGTFGIYAKGTVGGLKNGLQKSEEINVMVKKMCIPTKFFPSESCN